MISHTLSVLNFLTEQTRSVPLVPPKPVGYSAPSGQSADPAVPRPKPPIDGFERIAQLNKGDSSLGKKFTSYYKVSF